MNKASFPNKLSAVVAKVNNGPKFLRSFLLTRLFCSQVKYANTTGIRILSLSKYQAEIALPNRKKIRNHIGGIHAVAAALLAESTTGILVGLNMPSNKVPLIKTMTINYQRRMQGALLAKAEITEQQLAMIEQEPKGEMVVHVSITDESGEQPIECNMLWAWVEKREK